MLKLELVRGQVAEALVRSDGVVMLAPRFDQNGGLAAAAEPLQAEALVAKLAVERFVGAVLPWLARIDQRGVDPILGQPLEDGVADELRSAVRTQIGRGAMNADQSGYHVDHAARANRAGYVDRQALMSELVDHGKSFDLLAVGTGIEDEVIGPDMIGGPWRHRPGPGSSYAATGATARQLQPRLAPQPLGP